MSQKSHITMDLPCRKRAVMDVGPLSAELARPACMTSLVHIQHISNALAVSM